VTAILLGLLTAVLFGTAAYLGPFLSRDHSPSAVLAVGQGAAVAAASVPVLAWGVPAPATHWLVLGALAGVANGVALTAMFEAARFLRISVMAPIGATGGGVPVVVALALGERPSAWQLAGIPLALAGVVLVAAGQGRRSGTPAPPVRPAGLWLAAAWAASYGVFLSLFAEAARGGEGWAVLTSRVALLGTALTLPFLRGASLRLPARTVPLAVLNGLLILAGVSTFALASQLGLVSVTSVLSTLSPVVTVALAVVLLQERLAPGQRAGLVAAMVGVALLAAG
jgi:drug/metabolite transporter (DMT)-like permease